MTCGEIRGSDVEKKSFWNTVKIYLAIAGVGLAIGAIIAWRIIAGRKTGGSVTGSIQAASELVGRIQADSGAVEAGIGRAEENQRRAESNTGKFGATVDRLDQLNSKFAKLLAEISTGNG